MNLEVTGTKVFMDSRFYLNDWFGRPACTDTLPGQAHAVPLSGAFLLYEGVVSKATNAKGAFGFVQIDSNDPQHSGTMYLVSGRAKQGSAITTDTFEPALVTCAVRQAVKATWLNDRDQFQIPACDRGTPRAPFTTNLPRQFIVDSIIFFLFHGQNSSSAFDAVYQGVTYHIDNQFYPWDLADAMSWTNTDLKLNTQAAKAGNTYTAQWLLANLQFAGPEALALIAAAKNVYARFYAELRNLNRTEYKLDYWNPGWYQVRMSLEAAGYKDELKACNEAREDLRLIVEEGTYTHGFLDH